MAQTDNQLSHASQTDASRLAQSPFNGAPLARTTLWLMLFSLIGSVLFTITYLIEGVTRPGYNALQQPVSALSLGPGGWVQQVNFIVFGVFLLCTPLALRKALRGGVGVTWYPILRTLNGFSFIMLGLFSQDPGFGYPVGVVLTTSTPHGMIHNIFLLVSLITATTGCFIFARRLAMEPRWRGWAIYAVITGILIIVCVAIYGTLYSQHSAIAGIFERLSGGIDSVWGLLVIVRLFKIQRDVAGSKLL